MMELVHNDVIVKICCRFGGKLLRIEGLDGNKQMINAVGSVTATYSSPKLASFSTARKVYRLCFRISSRCATNSRRQGCPGYCLQKRL